MPTVADVLRRYGDEYLERFGATMPGEHKKVLRAIRACRTGELGAVLYACQSCGTVHMVARSCGNRHCPTCQHEKTQAWLEKQTDRLLPCPYFLVTFTLPAELREFARSHQRVIYSALFEASSEALRPWRPTPSSSAPIALASSASCRPGVERWSTTRTCTTWCPVVG